MGRLHVIVLDTHVWIWSLTKPEKLPKGAARVLARADRIGVPAICVWEVAMKAEAGKLRFDRPYHAWIDMALATDPRQEVCALSPRIAVVSAQLSWEHGDPADRFIVATARVLDAPLLTADERIHDAGLVRCVWD